MLQLVVAMEKETHGAWKPWSASFVEKDIKQLSCP
jgi:hypothetical protein